jgi:hypothetical protein
MYRDLSFLPVVFLESQKDPVLLVRFQLVSAYSLSQNIIESAETSRLFYRPNQPKLY